MSNLVLIVRHVKTSGGGWGPEIIQSDTVTSDPTLPKWHHIPADPARALHPPTPPECSLTQKCKHYTRSLIVWHDVGSPQAGRQLHGGSTGGETHCGIFSIFPLLALKANIDHSSLAAWRSVRIKNHIHSIRSTAIGFMLKIRSPDSIFDISCCVWRPTWPGVALLSLKWVQCGAVWRCSTTQISSTQPGLAQPDVPMEKPQYAV